MRSAIAAPATGLVDRYHLHFALGKALEDAGEFPASFEQYRLGNALKRPECRYRAELIERNTQQQIQVCTREFFAARTGYGDPSPDPIFIIGLPRSGSTLLEQILASHSRVEGTQELPNVQQLVSRLRGFEPEADEPRYPRILESLSAEEFRQLGANYLRETRVYRAGKPYFIDKMPNNFRHIGFIHLMLPNAKIIDARREPMACCFGNLKQLFAHGQEFTYSIEDIARYYRSYLELMRHWDRGAARSCAAGPARGRGGRTWRAAYGGCWRSAGWNSSRSASPSTRTGAACAPQAPSRCARRSIATGSSSGSTSNPGSGSSRTRSAMR